MLRHSLSLLAFLLSTFLATAQTPVLTQREQARIMDELLEDRVRTVLPGLMRREGIDLWLMISDEYNEDPVLSTFLPATWLSARRTTMLLIIDPGPGKELECISLSRYDMGKIFKGAWNPEHQPDQWAQLAKVIENKNPRKIAINKSQYYGHADGLSASNHERLYQSINKRFVSHIVSAEKLAIAWLETRSEREMILYAQVCRIAHAIMREGFSEKVIQAGLTTTDDVMWWYREKIKEMKLDTWFHPMVTIQRSEPESTFSKRPQPLVILPGDLLHVDFGITYLRLNTDMQRHAYVLKPGETKAPEYLEKALARGNKLQDILTRNFAAGKTGNQILEQSRKQAVDQGLTPSIYTHPIGYHGHGAGPTIGQWDMQSGVPYLGEYPLQYKTAYAIELNVAVYIIEWKKEIQIKLEEQGYFDETGFRYIDGRQTDLMLIP